MNAQSDGFFRNSFNYNNRTAEIDDNDGTGINNYGIGETVPLGGGLVVLLAACAGYAVARRRRSSKKLISLLLACLMLVAFTGCKKKLATISKPNSTAKSVYITLNSGDDSKVVVTPGFEDPETHQIYAKVDFEDGDIIYVGNNGKYCGYLEYDDETHNFSGTVAPESENDYLHFYFMGNKTPLNVVDVYNNDGNKIGYTATAINPAVNNTTTFSVNITNQTVKYPVISYAHSTKKYTSGVTSYSAKLQNYCSIMKFTTNGSGLSMDNPVTISGMFNKVTVNFAANNGATTGNPYSYAKMGITDEGDITLHAETATERWAIVLPNSERPTSGASAQGCYSLTNLTIPRIERNMYYASGKVETWIPLPVVINFSKLIDGAFSINNGNSQNNIPPTQVFYASGNLQCTTSAEPDANGEYDWSSAAYTWSFKTHQYDIDNYANTFDVGENCKKVNTISHFNWATSGWDNTANDAKATNFQPFATDFTDYTQHPTNRYHYGPTRKGEAYGNNTTDTVSLQGNYKNYDWGVYCSNNGTSASPYKITNGGKYSWRLLTVSEQSFILGPNTNPKPGGNCRRSSTVNGVPNARFIKACLTDASNGEGKGLYGLIIFPDTYIHPSSDLAPLPPKINDPNSAFTDNNYTIAQWTEMEKAKAVFLPAAGCRWTNPDASIIAYKIQDINNHCYYWSSSDDISHPSTHAKNMRIGTGDFVSNSYTQRVRGNCVRLVRIATSAE